MPPLATPWLPPLSTLCTPPPPTPWLPTLTTDMPDMPDTPLPSPDTPTTELTLFPPPTPSPPLRPNKKLQDIFSRLHPEKKPDTSTPVFNTVQQRLQRRISRH